MNAAKRIDLLCAAAVAAIFLALHMPGASSHAIHPDESDLLYPMLGLLRQNADLLRHCVVIHIGSFFFPVMIHTYHGPYEGYLSLPFLVLFGNTSRAVFYRAAFFDALSTGLIYWAARALFKDRLAALLAGFLWATSGFALASDFGLFWGTSVIGMVMLSVVSAADWFETGRPGAFVAASAWLGLACAARTWTVALPLAVLLAAIPFRRELRRPLGSLSPRRLAAAAGAFLVFFAPSLIGNALSNWSTLRFFATPGAAPAMPFSEALATVWRGLWDLLRAQTDRFPLIGNDRVPDALLGTIVAWGFLLAAALVLAEALRRRVAGGPLPKRHLFLLGVFAVYVLLSALSPTNKNANHLYPVLPFLYMNLAAFPLIFARVHLRRAAWALVFSFAAYSAAHNLRVIRWYQAAARAKGGSGPESSSAILDLSAWLTREKIRNPVVASLINVSGSLLYFGGGEIVPEDTSWGQNPAAPVDRGRWIQTVCAEDRTFIVTVDPLPERSTAPALAAIARACGKPFVKSRDFLSRDGRVVFAAYRTRR
ncbi:MAG: glycosyltransferase family 39 protein [Elusimicrobiota bacterium]